MRQKIDAHIMAVTGWDENTLSQHVKDRKRTFAELSSHMYVVDLNFFEKIGIVPRTSSDRAARITAARATAGIFDTTTKKGQAAMERQAEREYKAFLRRQSGKQRQEKI